MPEKVKTIHEKLLRIQSELKAPKNQYNNFGKFKYRSCEDILEAIKPLLEKTGLVIIFTDEIVPVDLRCYVKTTAKLTDGMDEVCSVSYAREPLAKKGMDEMQISGAAGSYARKYALNGLFLIDDSKDSDVPDEPKPKDKVNDIVGKAFFEFQKAHQSYLEEHSGTRLSKDKFVNAIKKQFGKLPTKVDSIAKIVKALKLSDIVDDEFDASMAEGTNG